MKFSFNASAKSGKLGVYTVVITAILLAVIVFANLLVNALPENVKKIDTTGFGVYTLSETTEKYLESLEKIADGKSNKVFLPLESSGVLGSVAGIAELFKQDKKE